MIRDEMRLGELWRNQFLIPPSPVRWDLPPAPLVVEVLAVAGEQHQLASVRVDGKTFVVLAVQHLLGVRVVPPWPRHLTHLTPGDGHLVRGVRLDAPLAVAELPLGVVQHHLISAAPVTAAGPDGRGRVPAHGVHTLHRRGVRRIMRGNRKKRLFATNRKNDYLWQK